jgi:hypothetical protein
VPARGPGDSVPSWRGAARQGQPPARPLASAAVEVIRVEGGAARVVVGASSSRLRSSAGAVAAAAYVAHTEVPERTTEAMAAVAMNQGHSVR